MTWYPHFVMYVAVFDAVVLIVAGFLAAAASMFGWNLSKFWDRALPAFGAIIGSNIAAAIILGIARWLVG